MREMFHRTRDVAWLQVVAGLALFGFVCVGCGDDNALDRLAVEGRVTLDGVPLPSGAVRFEPIDGKATAVGTGAVIVDGDYHIERQQGLCPGKYRVSVTSAQSDGATASAPSMDNDNAGNLPEERIPPRYNTQSELQIEVQREGPRRFDFDLTSR